MVKHLSRAAGALVIALVISVALAVPGGAQSAGGKPKATEVGVTASEIRIAVIADVDNPFAPGLFQGTVDGVKAGAAFLNSKAGGGGVAGRKVVVDFYDSHLDPTKSRNATIQACQDDLAMVGTTAIFLTSMDDIVNCPDQQGKASGMADINSFSATVAEACSPVSFPVNGLAFDCATIGGNPQTYHGQQGPAKFLLSRQKGLQGPMIISSSGSKSNPSGIIIASTNQKAGIKADQGTVVGVDPQATQSAFTTIVQKMKADGSTYALNTSSATQTLAMRNEATLQGLDSSKIVWDNVSAYGNEVVKSNAASFEGEYQALSFLPFEEATYNKTVANFLRFVKQVGGTPDQFTVYSWLATLAFADAAKAAVAKGGVNGLTRTSLIDGMKTLTAFDGGGMTGAHSFATAESTRCFVEMQFLSGKWVRQYPAKKGTFDCKAANTLTFQANLTGA